MDRAAHERPRTDRPSSTRPSYDRPRTDRPRTDRPTSSRPDSRSDTRPDSRPDTRPDTRPGTRPDQRPDTRPATRSGDRRPDPQRTHGSSAPARPGWPSASGPATGPDLEYDHKNTRPDGSSGPDTRPLRDAEDVRPDPDMDVESLDRDTLRELRSLGPVGTRVGKHLMTAGAVVEDDPEEALRQLRAAVQRGSRLPVVRETAGVIGYAAGDFAFALRELRTAARLGVGNHLLPLIVDCERALGRVDRALELAGEAGTLDPDTTVELAIVVSGIHLDRGDAAAALEALTIPTPGPRTPGGIRVRYARAEALAADGQAEAAATLFGEVARDDLTGLTDAPDRVAEGEGLSFDDLTDDDDLDEDGDEDDVEDGPDGASDTDAAEEPVDVVPPAADDHDTLIRDTDTDTDTVADADPGDTDPGDSVAEAEADDAETDDAGDSDIGHTETGDPAGAGATGGPSVPNLATGSVPTEDRDDDATDDHSGGDAGEPDRGDAATARPEPTDG